MKILPIASTLVLALAGAAQAAPSAPPLSTTERYFDCTTMAPAGTIADDTDAFSWSPTPPAASFTTGAGCGWSDVGGVQGTNQPNPFYDAAYGGVHKGEINEIELTLYSLFNNPQSTTKTINVKVIVDGETVFAGTNMTAPKIPAGQAAVKSTFTIPDLDIPAGKDDKYVVIAVADASVGLGAWAHGAREVPAGVKLYDLPAVEEPVQ